MVKPRLAAQFEGNPCVSLAGHTLSVRVAAIKSMEKLGEILLEHGRKRRAAKVAFDAERKRKRS